MTDTELAKKDEGVETTDEAVKTLKGVEWYKHFIEELRAEVVETEFNLRSDYIRLYHSIGKQIQEKIASFKGESIFGMRIAETVAQDIGKSKSSVDKAMQFYKMYPDLEGLLAKEGKNISWSKITQKYLPTPAEKVKSPAQVEEGKDLVPPEIYVTWNKDLGLWDIKIKKEDLQTINLLGFKKEIEDFFVEQSKK